VLIQHLPRFINLYAGLFRTRVCGGEIADGSFEVRMPQPTHERPNRHTSFMVERCIGSPEFVKPSCLQQAATLQDLHFSCGSPRSSAWREDLSSAISAAYDRRAARAQWEYPPFMRPLLISLLELLQEP